MNAARGTQRPRSWQDWCAQQATGKECVEHRNSQKGKQTTIERWRSGSRPQRGAHGNHGTARERAWRRAREKRQGHLLGKHPCCLRSGHGHGQPWPTLSTCPAFAFEKHKQTLGTIRIQAQPPGCTAFREGVSGNTREVGREPHQSQRTIERTSTK